MKNYDFIDNIFIRPGERTFGYSDGDAAEDYLLHRIMAAADVSTGSAELAAAIRDWPSLYHLSPQRADLLRPLSTLLNRKKILEIGCGCGALTRFLGELGCQVTALEGSRKRALITRERCRDQENVRVVCDNFSDFQCDEHFDIVLLVGVLEYSHQFIKGNYPPLDMLRRAKEYLRPGGSLVLAIENQLGLKYWAGAPEDHTGRAFDGIEDKYTTDTAVTFGKTALARLLSGAGFPSREFLYPFPDYKLPEVIVKEEAFSAKDLRLQNLLHEKFDYPHGNGQATEFSATRAAGPILENKLMADLANSFLVVARIDDVTAGVLPPDNTLVYTYNSVRKKYYCKSNLIARTAEGSLRVIRARLYPQAPLPADEPITHHIRDENYIPGKLLSTYALDIVTREGWSLAALELWANRYYQVLLDHAAEEPGMLDGRYLDLTPFNILVTDEDRTMVFDQEWHCPDDLPLYFIFFRGLVYTLDKISMYAPPAANTPVDLIPLVTALINTFFPFGATQVEACIRLEEKYFQAIPLLPGQPFSHGRIHLKSLRKPQLTEVQAQLEKTVRELAVLRLQSQQQVARIHQDHQAHIGLLHQQIDWYRRSYEERSLPGVLLQRRLSSARAQQKYLTAFLLASAQEKGTKNTLSLILKTIFSKGWQGLRHPRKTLMSLMRTPATPPVNPSLMYSDQDPTQAAADIRSFTRRPKISFIMPVYNTDPRWLQKAVDSIRGQWYDNWELCIADDGSTHQGTRQLLRRLEDHSPDPRITIIRLANNAGISEASNAALELADGDYIALMDHDDEITPDALYQVVKDLQLHGDADILYTDECKVDEEGHLSDPFYKPAYSEELLLNMMYAGHLTIYKKDFLLKKVGRFRPAYDLSQDYDLMLRAVEQTTRIRHIEKVLYHWRMTAGSSSQGEKPHARITNLAALGDAMKRRNIPADIIELPAANRVKLHITDPKPLVSIIIPTDSRENLSDTLESIYTQTDYPHIEVVVVTNSLLMASPPASSLIPSAPGSAPVYVPYDKPYNFSDKCNHGATRARGEILIFFNDDVRPLQTDWVDNTIEYLFIPGVGGVSPRLVYEDDSIQYAGMASGVRGLTGTTFHGYPKDSTAYINFPQSVRNVSILSGACLAIKKDVFEAIGGFDSVNTPSSHSDVDLSFRLLEAGRRCVYTPYATLRHIGHLSLREYDRSPASRRKDKADIYLLRRWAQRLATDPYFTTAMRDHLYHDSPEPYRIYAPEAAARELRAAASADILLVSHDLSLSGAPVMLLQLCRLLIRSGYFVTVICEKDGPMCERFLHEGAPVILDSILLRQHDTLSRFARNFDHIICNTVVTWPVVRQLSAEVHTIWWLHEAKLIGSFAQDPGFIETLAGARHIVGPSDYSLLYIREYNPHPIKIYYGYPDIAPQPRPRTANEKIIFSIFGSIEPRKGQDVLVRALQQLDPEMQDSIEIWLVGRQHDADYYQQLLFTIGSAGNIKVMGERDHRECLDLMRRSDVIVCTSRDDPFPVVIVEALCLSKPCIVTSHTGFFELITDGVDGFVIPNEDSEALASKMAYLMQHPQTMTPMGRAARQLYEQHLTMDGFTKKFLSLLGTEPQPMPARQLPAQKTMLCQD